MDKKRSKGEIVAEYLIGETSTRKLAMKYGYGHSTISRWVMAHQRQTKQQPLRYSKAVLESEQEKLSTVEELQEALRLSRLKVELLEAMIDISDEQFGTEIRKKAGARQS
jgi:transposase-like protein